MESFFRYVGYIDLFEEENRISTAGYLIWEYKKNHHELEIQIKESSITDSHIKFIEEKKSYLLAKIELQGGYGRCHQTYSVDKENKIITRCGNPVHPKEITKLTGELKDGRRLSVELELPYKKENRGKEDVEKKDPPKKDISKKECEICREKIEYQEEKKETVDNRPEILEPMKEDKWQQLCKKYKVISPFVGEQKFISLRLEDFIILQEGYQKLVHNSFLLHGYYNYGHLILGRLEEKEEAPYYIGVPGVYYESEKKAARMFGFIGFEGADRMIENGSYGYYMIEVKI